MSLLRCEVGFDSPIVIFSHSNTFQLRLRHLFEPTPGELLLFSLALEPQLPLNLLQLLLPLRLLVFDCRCIVQLVLVVDVGLVVG